MTCCGEVIKNTALGKDFYVCRECKKEVVEKPKNEIILDEYEDFSFVAPGSLAAACGILNAATLIDSVQKEIDGCSDLFYGSSDARLQVTCDED